MVLLLQEMLTLAEDLRAKQEALTSSAKLQSDVLAHLEHLERLAHLKIAEAPVEAVRAAPHHPDDHDEAGKTGRRLRLNSEGGGNKKGSRPRSLMGPFEV